ncbi:LysR family transcriptional regulator [Aquitalea pelogenes]|uniref:LysR family transcriptional regulator n=1 Tax=Aquitalea pelogenes TaxID=1293573 RepID=UPI0007899E02|nr:LysR family transcriptional regulator [Aquitalea pelogenes]
MRRLPSLTALRFFEESARHMSFNKSAMALCVTPGAVSRQIRLLEEALGTTLFYRDHTGIRLTRQGQALHASLAEAFDVIEQATHIVIQRHPPPRKRLTVITPPTFATRWLSPRLGSLLQALPGIDFSILTDNTEPQPCSIRFGHQAQRPCRSELLFIEQHVLVGGVKFRGQHVETLLQQLPTLHVLHGKNRLSLWPDWLDAAGLPNTYADNGIEFSTLDQAIHAACAGMGLAVVDRNMIAHELLAGALLQLSPIECHGPYGYWLETHASHEHEEISAFSAWLHNAAAQPGGNQLVLA